MSATACIGILILDTQFVRIVGDVGNPETFSYPVKYSVISGATVDQIVAAQHPSKELTQRFIEAARKLEQQGAVGLITSCGYLSVLQKEIAQAVRIPVITSALNLIPLVRMSLNNKPIGIITADESKLSENALKAAGVAPGEVQLAGMQSSKNFARVILRAQHKAFDPQLLCDEVMAVAKNLNHQFPSLAAIVLECTNLEPYAAHLSRQLKMPVFGIVNAADLLWRSANPVEFT